MTWARSSRPRVCGVCRELIAIGAPMAVLTIGHLTKVRCGVCAGGPVPPDLPASIVQAPAPPIDVARLGLLPLDWSRRTQPMGREREPGEEG